MSTRKIAEVETEELHDAETGLRKVYIKVRGQIRYRIEAQFESANPLIVCYTNHGVIFHRSAKDFTATVAALIAYHEGSYTGHWMESLIAS